MTFLDKLLQFEKTFIKYAAILLVLLVLFNISGFSTYVLKPEQLLPIIVAMVYLLGFLIYPIGDHSKLRNALIDWTLAVVGFVSIAYAIVPATFFSGGISRYEIGRPFAEYVFSVLSIALLIELARRAGGLVFMSLVIIFLAYAFVGGYIPLPWTHKPLDWLWFLDYFYAGNIYYGASEGLFGGLTQLAVGAIAGFVIFGSIMIAIGMGKFFMDLFQAVAGHMSGGPAKVAIFASAMSGTMTGSPAANVMITGTFTIPAMIRSGFAREVAAAIEAAASTGGEIMPPIMGAGAFIMAHILGVPYVYIAACALPPAIIWFLTKFTSIHYYAKSHGLTGLPKHMLPRLRDVIKEGYLYFLPLILLIAFLIYLPSIMQVAFYTIIASILIALLGKRSRPLVKEIPSQLIEGIKPVIMITIIIIAADVISTVMAMTGLGTTIVGALKAIFGANLVLGLVVAMLLSLLYGLVVPATAAYILTAVTVVPAMIAVGIDPLAAHMFAFYFAIVGPITPPVAIATYAACSIAARYGPCNYWRAGLWGVIFAITGFVAPFVWIFDPSLILRGSLVNTLIRFTLLGLGTTTLAAAIFRWYLGPIGIPMRVLLGITALLLIYPDLTYTMNLAGVIILGVVTLLRKLKRAT